MMLNKKSMFLVSLVILLVVVGYINQRLIQMNSNEVSSDYQNYEKELADLNDFNLADALETSGAIEANEDIIVVDSKDDQVLDLAKQTNSVIENIINEEENRKRTNYYVEYRLSRDKLRANLIESLQFIIDNDNSTEEMRNEAQDKIVEITDIALTELVIEQLIKSKGIKDAIVFLSSENARVVVEVEDLNEQHVVKILDIVMEQTNLNASKITIMKRF